MLTAMIPKVRAKVVPKYAIAAGAAAQIQFEFLQLGEWNLAVGNGVGGLNGVSMLRVICMRETMLSIRKFA